MSGRKISMRYGLLVALIAVSGCSSFKAKPAPTAGFIPADITQSDKRFPFHRSWVKPDVDWSRYSKIIIAPVNTDYLREMSWWKALERGPKSIEADCAEIADYAHNALTEAFADDEARRFEVVAEPAPGSLTLELALTEIVPSKVTLNALGYAPFIGTPVKLIRWFSKSKVSFEAKISDGATGEVLALFADREHEKISPINFKDLTWYGHTHVIIKEWAGQFVELFHSNLTEAVADSKAFTLKPW